MLLVLSDLCYVGVLRNPPSENKQNPQSGECLDSIPLLQLNIPFNIPYTLCLSISVIKEHKEGR